ncbi:MAG: hypothetical protein ACOX5Z_11895 [Desulfobulbus sp.]
MTRLATGAINPEKSSMISKGKGARQTYPMIPEATRDKKAGRAFLPAKKQMDSKQQENPTTSTAFPADHPGKD